MNSRAKCLAIHILKKIGRLKVETKEKDTTKRLVESLLKDQIATRAYQKLNRPPLEVNVYRHSSSVEALQNQLSLFNERLEDVKDETIKQDLNKKKQFAEEQLAKLEKDKIDGYLVPLTWRDLNDIKAAVTEAIVHFSEYKFDSDVQLVRIAAEERFMTVFCALKQKDDKKTRFFKSLEEIAEIDDLTIFDLYQKWEDHFVLTDKEIKN